MAVSQLKRLHLCIVSSTSLADISVNLCKYPQARKWVFELVVEGEAHAIPIEEALDLYVDDGAPKRAVTLENVATFLGGMFD